MNDKETQEFIQARSQGKKKDLKIRESNGMLMQKSRMVTVSIISDKGPRFTSKFWVAFQEALSSRHLDLMEFAYNNSYHSSIGMSPFEALYGVVRFGKKGKLSPRYIGPYQIIERVGEVTYRLELPPKLSKVYDVVHVSMLRHYVSDPSHVIPPQPLEINPDLTYDEEPVTILDLKDKVLRNKTMRLVKVCGGIIQWRKPPRKQRII
ncbi:uncharacterized protein [Malus domestica]|uniref:uncharacterized protein n=1 Tax=Malus domestica TaxID=3750 RepID=UPI003976E85A